MLENAVRQAAAPQPAPPLLVPRKPWDKRTPERLFVHFREERRLAAAYRQASSPEERARLGRTMYDELFRLVPDHPRWTRAKSKADSERNVAHDLAFLRRFVRRGSTFMEIGAGDCRLSARVAEIARSVVAVDLSDQTAGSTLPGNVRLVLTNGRDIPVPQNSVDVAFSDQVMEHLHPDDALEQVTNVFRALKRGGVYVCITPNRLYGPTDISGYFSPLPRGFHMREYALPELGALLSEAGFTRIDAYMGSRGWYARTPRPFIELLEGALERLPYRRRRRIADTPFIRPLLGLRVAAFKD